MPEDMIRPKDAAKLLCCTANTVLGYIKQGKLRGWTRGTSRYVLDRNEVLALLEPVAPIEMPLTGAQIRANHEAAVRALRYMGLKF